MEAMAAALEYVTSLMAHYRMVEDLYLSKNFAATQQLYDAIVRLYTAILVYLARARRYYTKNTGSKRIPPIEKMRKILTGLIGRIVTSVVQSSESSLDAYLHQIKAEERKVEKWIGIINTQCMFSGDAHQTANADMTTDNRGAALSAERGLAGLNDKISALTDQFESFQIGLHSRIPDTPVTLAQILEWLDAVYTASEYERALCARLEGTCEWMFQRSVFQLWRTVDLKSDVTKVLWVHGAPGFGKTILCASIIEFLRRSVEGPVCYFFCDFGDDSKRHPQAILRSWIAQLVKYSNEAYSLTLEHFRERNGHTATDLELWSLFRKLCFAIRSCFFVVDGFDECLRNSQENKKHFVTDERTRFLHQLAESLDHTGSRVLLVSRETSEIRDEFMKGWQNASTPNETSGSREVVLRNADQMSFLDYHMTQADTGADIKSFANGTAAARLPNKHTELQQDLAQKASEKCNGMFLWIRLLYDRLSPGKNTKQLQRVISETPAGLEQAYQRDLMGIAELPVDERERALSILQWVLFGRRPLTVRGLTEALLVDTDDMSGSFPKDDLPDAWDEYHANETIRKPCGSLIELRGQSIDASIAEMTVHLVHFSVEEFLLNTDNVKLLLTQETRVMNPIHVNGIIAQKCLTYLCYEELYRDHHSQGKDILDLSKRYAFLSYAAESWHQHVNSGEERSPELVDIVNHFLDPTVTRWLLFSDYRFYQSNQFQKPEGAKHWLTSSPLHIASEYGLVETINCLMSQDVEIDLVCGRRGTALHTAIFSGQVEAVKRLLANGASLTLEEQGVGNALHWLACARSKRNVQIILKILLTSGADLEGKNNKYQATPLLYAAAAGFKDLVLWLLEAGAEVDGTSHAHGTTPLIAASMRGCEEVVDVLLRNGANVNAITNNERTALVYAARRGHIDVVKTLLQSGANVDALDNEGKTALSWAAVKGHESAATTLLERRASSNTADNNSLTPLHYATICGSKIMISLLLDNGAETETKDSLGRTPLFLAATQGQMSAVEFLLKRGADANTQIGGYQSTLLQLAAAEGNDALLVLLLDHGADIEMGHDGWTPLFYATSLSHTKTCRALLSRGANTKVVTDNGRTPLDIAIICGGLKIVQLLLEHKDSPQAWCDQIFALMQWVLSKKAPSARARNALSNWKSYIRLRYPEVVFLSDDLKYAEPSNSDLVIRQCDTSQPVRKSHLLGMAKVHFCKPELRSRSRRGRKQ